MGLTLASMLIGGVLFGGFSYHLKQVLEQEVTEKAGLIFAQVDAVQGYVRRTLRPKMFKELPDTFLIEAMSSSYISRNIMADMDKDSETHVYRRVAIGARNPAYEANALERRLVETFRADPTRERWLGYEQINGVKHFVMARPVVFKKSCLRCHGMREDAPMELVKAYGDRGFEHRENSIDGVDVVGLPVSVSVARLHDTIMSYLLVFAFAALLYFGAANFIFKWIVANNIRTLTTSFRRNFSDDKGTALIREVEQGDEIGGMIAGIEKLSDYLYDTRQQLQNYASNLENMVEDRTKELAEQAEARRSDVELFVRLLAESSRSGSRHDLWRATLPLVAKRFDLESVSYICTFATNRHYSWPDAKAKPPLPEDWLELLTQSRPKIEGSRACIPVESTSGNAEGLLCLYHKPGNSFEAQDTAVLGAIGRQLGIGADNITALDSILRHNTNLQAIFEGITEPLLLVDGAGLPIAVNDAARKLGRDLSGGIVDDGNFMELLCEKAGLGKESDVSTSIETGMVVSRDVSLAGGRSFSLSIYPVKDVGKEKSERAVVYVSETTEKKRLLAQMTQSEKMATVGKLASGLAHEINNPLGVILCYAELLKKSMPQGQAGEDLDVIIKHTHRAQSVLKDLLNFARPKVSANTSIDMPSMLKSLVDVFRVQAEKQGADISLETLGDIPPVQIDAQAFEHIIMNLLINALDAMAPNALDQEAMGPNAVTPDAGTPDATAHKSGSIHLHLQYDAAEGAAILQVKDKGSGIAEEHLQYIFDPFFTTKDVNKGSGLGLAVVFGFMSDLGGSITAENGDGGGAVFTLRFPVTAGEQA
jgi:signal transduction histidine kinase